MEVKYGSGRTQYGPGVEINLDGNELAIAIHAYLVARGVNIQGPRTVTVNGELCQEAQVYVDPSGFVTHEGMDFLGRGPGKAEPR